MAKILVVDDIPANRALIVTLVGHSGHQPLEAADGAQALAMVRAERPELVISDILMPTMDGYEFVRQLRNDPDLAATQVILCSAHYREEEARSLAQACGVAQVLLKPCEPQDILAAIAQALSAVPSLPARPLEHAFQTRHLRLMTDKLTDNMAELQAMNQRLAALTDLNLQLACERDPQVLMVNVCDGARHLVGAQYVVLCVVCKDIEACLSCTSGIDASTAGPLDLPAVSHGLLGQVRADRQPRRIAGNLGGDPCAVGLPAGYPAVHQALIVPIASLSFSYGWLCLANKLGGPEFSEEDEKTAAILGAQVGRIYENGSLYVEVQRNADRLQREVQERREAEQKIERLNRVYAVLSGISTLIVRVHTREELFREACNIAVKHGRFLAAWIARVDCTLRQVVPEAQAGVGQDILMGIQDRLRLHDAPTPGESLSSVVVRTQRPVVSGDIRNDPRVLLFVQLLGRGVASIAALPLLVAGQVVGVLALFSDEVDFFDATEMKLLTELAGDIGFALDHLDKEARLSYLAYYDDITGLPNRTLFLERCGQYLRPRDGARPLLGVALLDISRFRFVNDTLGRQGGDELLRQVAQRLQQAAGEAHDIARIGINSFGITVTDARDANGVALAVDHLLRSCFGAPFIVGTTELRMAAKVGVALHPMDGDDAEALLHKAEAATNKAKAAADKLLFYTTEMNLRVAETLSMEGRLREALEGSQFVLHYQPKQHLATGAIEGAEALIRWNDPHQGIVPPGQFIHILEETGLIYDVGHWALRQALADNQRWRRAGHLPLRVAVNVSSLQLRHRDFIAQVASAIAHDPLAAAGLELEITESMVMEDVEHSTGSLHALRQMGITIAIDDFGTGFSSLSYLARLPVDTLKIDRAFILGMATGLQGLALVSTIINLGHSLGLNVVAEGVESAEQQRQLALQGCDEMQGYLLSRPLPADVFEERFLRPARVSE